MVEAGENEHVHYDNDEQDDLGPSHDDEHGEKRSSGPPRHVADNGGGGPRSGLESGGDGDGDGSGQQQVMNTHGEEEHHQREREDDVDMRSHGEGDPASGGGRRVTSEERAQGNGTTNDADTAETTNDGPPSGRSTGRTIAATQWWCVGCTLYVRNLPTHLQSEHVRSYFSRHGDVIDCRIVINPVTKESRGFGFVSYRTPEMAERAMANMDQVEIEGRTLRVEKARRNKPHDPTPGEYKGPTGASIKYDNRGRLKPGYVPYWDLPVPRHAQNSSRSGRYVPERRSHPRRRSFSRGIGVVSERRTSYGRYHNSSNYYSTTREAPYPSRYSPRAGLSSSRGNDAYHGDRLYRGEPPSPRRAPSPAWDSSRSRYRHDGGGSSYDNSRDSSRPEYRYSHGYSSTTRYTDSHYPVRSGTQSSGYYGDNGIVADSGRSRSGYAAGGYRDVNPSSYEPGERRSALSSSALAPATGPSRYGTHRTSSGVPPPVPSSGGSGSRRGGDYYVSPPPPPSTSSSAKPSGHTLSHRSSGRSRSPPGMRGQPPQPLRPSSSPARYTSSRRPPAYSPRQQRPPAGSSYNYGAVEPATYSGGRW